jgi:hypothetical protein
MEITLEILNRRRQMLMVERDLKMGEFNKIQGALLELQMVEDFLTADMAIVSQEEMDKVKTFPAKESEG